MDRFQFLLRPHAALLLEVNNGTGIPADPNCGRRSTLTGYFAKGLSRNGYSCDTAGSADEANNLLRVEEFDLVLLDISMPGKTGVSLLATLSKSFPDMAIIMVSGNDDLETATFAMRQGADDCLAKPVPISLLVYRIEKALLRRALVLENRAYRVHLEIW